MRSPVDIFSPFFLGRDVTVDVHLPQSEANERINQDTDSHLQGIFFSALSGYAYGETVSLDYSPLFFRGAAIEFTGCWVKVDGNLQLQGKLRTTPLLKLIFFLFALGPLFPLTSALMNNADWGVTLGNGFGFLALTLLVLFFLIAGASMASTTFTDKIKHLLS